MGHDVSEDRIRQRAHQLWEQGGRLDGEHDKHWQKAVDELTNEDELSKSQAGSRSNEVSDGPSAGVDSLKSAARNKEGVDGLG